MTKQLPVWDLQHDAFILHTRARDLDSALRAKLRLLTIKPVMDSWMVGVLDNDYANPGRTGRVHVFVLYDPAVREAGWAHHGLEPLAWATVYHAQYKERSLNHTMRCNEVSIFVHPGQRGRGLGTRLLSFAKDQLKHTKRRFVAIPDTEAGCRCYAKSGVIDVSDWIPVSTLDDPVVAADDLELMFACEEEYGRG